HSAIMMGLSFRVFLNSWQGTIMRSDRMGLVLSTALVLAACCRTSAGEVSPADYQPDPLAVERYGPAYRYPQAGWIVLDIEGGPYDRGYQHGRLLSSEIAAFVRCGAACSGHKDPAEAWKHNRKLVNALFLRRYQREYLEEMKGIAHGASAAGA